MTQRDRLLEVHGDGNCHICGNPKRGKGAVHCSYPHAMLPDKEIAPGMWSWRADGELIADPKDWRLGHRLRVL